MNSQLNIIIILFALLGGLVANLFSLKVILPNSKLKTPPLPYLAIPFLIIVFSGFKKNSIRLIFILNYFLGVLAFLFFALSLNNIFSKTKNLNAFEVFSVSILLLVVLCILLFLAVYDIHYFKVPDQVTKQLILIVIIANIAIGISKILNYEIAKAEAFSFIELGTYSSLAGLILGYAITFLIVKFSNEKALGMADVEIIAVVGAILGIKATFIFLLTLCILGSFLGICYALYLRKFKDILIPLVPIILLAFVICLGFSDNIFRLIF